MHAAPLALEEVGRGPVAINMALLWSFASGKKGLKKFLHTIGTNHGPKLDMGLH
jgi:hypothetical protein